VLATSSEGPGRPLLVVVILIAQTPHSILKDSVYETTSGKELSILGHCRFAELVSVNTSRHIVTYQCSMSALAIWHSSRLNNCLTRLTKEKKASDKGIRQNL
jgi:hypothetical protein